MLARQLGLDGQEVSPIEAAHGSPVSTVVLTYMEEANLEACLRSIAEWSTDIHVVDSGSTDRTLEIATQMAHHVHHHEFVDHTSQIEFVLKEIPIANEWLLILDADHTVTSELKESIDSMLSAGAPGIDLFYCRQTYIFRGQAIKSLKKWGRLLRHRNVEIEGGELVDFRYRVTGATGFLRGQLIEHNQKENDLDFWIDKHQKFATRLAVEEVLRRAGQIEWSVRPRLWGNPDERMIWFKSRWYCLPLFVRPFLYFGYRYVWKLGFLDGHNGFLFHFLQAFWFRLLVDVNVSNLERRIASGNVSIEELTQSFRHSFGRRPAGAASATD
jgi:glycosyltransferase involved in cell wall biosynthesis